MKLKEFLEKFSPDYEAKYAAEFKVNIRGMLPQSHKVLMFYEKHFPEALQNFADKICYEQCKHCAEVYNENLGYTQPDNSLYNAMVEAKQPKIDEL